MWVSEEIFAVLLFLNSVLKITLRYIWAFNMNMEEFVEYTSIYLILKVQF